MRRGDNTRYHSAKKLTMHRLLQMDHDIAPRYEEDDDSQIPPPVIFQMIEILKIIID